VIAEAKTFYGI